MPWPLSSKSSKTRAGTATEADAVGPAAVSLTEASAFSSRQHNLDPETRRSASLDIVREGAGESFSKKAARRSSFPRLGLASWRTSGVPTATGVDNSGRQDDADEVELQLGHGTPYSASGLRGGFAVYDSPHAQTHGSPSSRSDRSRGTGESSDGEGEDGNSWEDSLRTPASSITRVGVSPNLTPIDSGFAEFSPDSIIIEDLQASVRTEQGSKASNVPEEVQDSPEYEGVAISNHKKTRSKGWFSFNIPSSSAPTQPPTVTDASLSPSSSAKANARTTASHPSIVQTESIAKSSRSRRTEAMAGSPAEGKPSTTQSTTAASVPVSTKSRLSMTGSGFLKSAGRKRGDSEVSMKEIPIVSLEVNDSNS